jgi:DNA-binding transcriptional LysR family regulator
LELFLSVIETGSVTEAAARAGLSPGAVSQQLHKLAAETRAELFVKSGRKLKVTPAGRRLAERAGPLLAHLKELRQEFGGGPDTDARPFHLASGATTLIHRLGPALRLLRRRYPKSHIQVTVAATEEMVEGLLSRRFDLAIISLPLEDQRLNIVPLYDEELLLLQPSARRVTGWHVGSVAVEELTRLPFLLYPPHSNMRMLIDRFFAGLGVDPEVIMEASDTEVIMRLVESGFGQAILPEYALRRNPRHFRVMRVDGKRLVRRQALATVRTAYPRLLTCEIAGFLKQRLGK